MKINFENLNCLLQQYANGNYTKFARLLGVDVAHLYRLMKYQIGGGTKIIGAIIKFCEENDLDYNNYIFLS